MQTFIAVVLMSFLSFSVTHSLGATDSKRDTASPEKNGVILKWPGTAGWEIQTKTTTILIDPFLTRKDRSLNAPWQTDESAVLKAIARADYIFAGHSHHDHIGDIPFIAKRFKSKIIGSRTTTNIALTAGVDKSQTVTVSGGEQLDFKEF
jgi:L-ascorbate metabolism protein UlaG (beta-lactamase superfamily)